LAIPRADFARADFLNAHPNYQQEAISFWSGRAHGIRNEIVASKHKNKGCVASTYRQDEGRRGEKSEKRKEDRSCLAKKVIHREQGGENRQRDPLDERSQVEDERRHVRAVSSSDLQTQDLGKPRG
jgi:hypothetical protein